MLPRHTLQTITNGYLVITNPAHPNIQPQSVVSFLDDDTFFINHTNNDMSYRPKEDCLIRLPFFNVGYVPFKCTLTVKGVDMRVITGQIVITESESKLHKTPCVQTIQLDVSESICGEDYTKITTNNASFDALYPLKIEKCVSDVEVKDYAKHPVCTGESRKLRTMDKKSCAYVKPDPVYKKIQRPNQVWGITEKQWKIIPKPHPRNRAWEWHDDTLSWVCQKNKDTGELMPLNRTGMSDCWPALELNPAVPSNPLDTPNPSNPIDKND
jgi:hypothetical protein